MSKIVKESFIIILLAIVIMFALVILFYDCVSENTEEVSSIEDSTSKEVTEVLNEIKNNGSMTDNKDSNQLLKSYTVNKSDLTENAENKIYDTGKKDPFSKTTNTTIEDETTDINIIENNTQTENSEETEITNDVVNKISTNESNKDDVSQTPKVTEDNNKNIITGTFFENKSSK